MQAAKIVDESSISLVDISPFVSLAWGICVRAATVGNARASAKVPHQLFVRNQGLAHAPDLPTVASKRQLTQINRTSKTSRRWRMLRIPLLTGNALQCLDLEVHFPFSDLLAHNASTSSCKAAFVDCGPHCCAVITASRNTYCTRVATHAGSQATPVGTTPSVCDRFALRESSQPQPPQRCRGKRPGTTTPC